MINVPPRKSLALILLLLAVWIIFHHGISFVTKGIGEPAFSTAVPFLVDIIVMLIALMITRKPMLWMANIALIDIVLSTAAGDYFVLVNLGKEGLANTLAVTGILTGLMANAKYFGRKYFEKRLKRKKKRN